MLKTNITNPNSDNLATTIKVIGLIAFTVWIAHFLHFRQLGLYGDDYVFARAALGQDWSFLTEAFRPLLTWPHGRPIYWALAMSLTFLGDQLGGISGIQVINFLLISFNAYLCYRVLRFVTLPSAAIAGALFFCLFPLNAARHPINISFAMQSSMGFLMGATLAYLMDKKLLSYGLIFGSLLSYEIPFLGFFAAPLLPLKKWDREFVKEWLRHVLILVGMLAIIVIIRKMLESNTGDYHSIRGFLQNSSLGSTAFRLTTGPLIGTLINFVYLVRAPYQSLMALIRGESSWVIVVVYFLVTLTVLITVKYKPLNEIDSTLNRESIDSNVNQPGSIAQTMPN